MSASGTPARDPEITLWWTRIDTISADVFRRLESVLETGERERADRFRVSGARSRFVVGRALLRSVLANMIGCQLSAPRFAFGEHGKPHLTDPAHPAALRFNLAHSGSVVVMATAPRLDLGVDVEELSSSRPVLDLAERFFTFAEATSVASADEAQRQKVFLHLWTAKEAVLKATGSGLSVPVREVEIDPDPDASPRVLNLGGDTAAASEWTLLRHEVPGEWIATIAYRGPELGLGVREIRLGEIEKWVD